MLEIDIVDTNTLSKVIYRIIGNKNNMQHIKPLVMEKLDVA